MTKSLLNKLLLTRRLLTLAKEHISSSSELSLNIGVNLLQDGVETFLIAVSEHVNAGIGANTTFDKYFEFINAKIDPKELPFRVRLLALNKLRVNSKHYGLIPARSEVDSLLNVVQEFVEEVTRQVLGSTFADVSLVDLLVDGDAKEYMKEAQQAFSQNDFASCLINCRKAIFVRIEQFYDVLPFGREDRSPQIPFFLWRGRDVAYYARNKQYIDMNVKDPTDYIVLNHDKIELELMKTGIDSVSFWNIHRLTPQVYQFEDTKLWVVKNDVAKLDENGIKERASYVLDTTVNLLVASDQRTLAVRTSDYVWQSITLSREGVPVYKKADIASEVVAVTPAGLKSIDANYSVPGLDGTGRFWHVLEFRQEHIWGFISDEDVEH